MTDVKEQSETLLSATSNRSSIPSDLYSVHVKVKSSSPQRSYRSKRAPLGLVADGRESLTGRPGSNSLVDQAMKLEPCHVLSPKTGEQLPSGRLSCRDGSPMAQLEVIEEWYFTMNK
ncbi:hypothetical protein F2Q69_00048027 [Brassica cretica]|uniref:Uncharacterized protein n=1 Tax=Brassica cretica TaxID=69181 RepID=A0A8S9PTX6_BRACR|nr:hypothetical protein F2Q69_00048027 [Brassica cretica]